MTVHPYHGLAKGAIIGLMVNFTRRLLPILFSGLLLVPLASTVAAEDAPPSPADDAALLQDGVDLVHMTNDKRENLGRSTCGWTRRSCRSPGTGRG